MSLESLKVCIEPVTQYPVFTQEVQQLDAFFFIMLLIFLIGFCLNFTGRNNATTAHTDLKA